MLLFISCWVPSAICFHLVNNASLNSMSLIFKQVPSRSLRQPSNMLGRCPPQTSAKPLHWSPSHSLCCTAYSDHARGSSICLLLLWLERLWSSEFFLFPYLPIVFWYSYSPCKLVKSLSSWGVYTAHTAQWGLWTCQGHLGATVMQIIVIIKVQ